MPAKQLEILEKNFSLNLKLIKKLEKLEKDIYAQKDLIAKCSKCRKYLVDFLVVLKCMHNYCIECLEDLKQNNKNCIFKCSVKNSSSSSKKFELNSEYFVKSLKENMALRADLLSKKAEVILSIKNNSFVKNSSGSCNNNCSNDNKKEKHLKLEGNKEKDRIEDVNEELEENDLLFDSNLDKEVNELDGSFTHDVLKENYKIEGDSERINVEQDVEDSYEIIKK